jgi:phage terminase small subunit
LYSKHVTPSNDKRTKFVEHYTKHLNATDAARYAGYKMPGYEGCRLLANPFVKAELDKRRKAAERAHGISRDRIIREYAKLAFTNMTDLAEWDAASVTLKASKKLKKFHAAAVEEVSSQETKYGTNVKIKAHDKKAALDSLCRVLGYNLEVAPPPSVTAVVRLSLEDDEAQPATNAEDVEPEDDAT